MSALLEAIRRHGGAQLRKHPLTAHWLAELQGHTRSSPEYEEAMRLVVPGTAVLDVGAYVGNFTIGFAREVGPGGTVIALEPQDGPFQELRNATSGSPNVIVLNVAASDHSGTALLTVPRDAHSAPARQLGSLEPSAAVVGETQEVKLERLDDIAAPYVVSLIKIDVEGHERRVLAGAQAVLEAHHPSLVIEIEQRHIGAPASISDVVDLLLALGYECRCIAKGGLFPWRDFDVKNDQLRWLTPDGALPVANVPSYVNNFAFTWPSGR